MTNSELKTLRDLEVKTSNGRYANFNNLKSEAMKWYNSDLPNDVKVWIMTFFNLKGAVSSPNDKGQKRATAKAIRNKTICAKSAMGIKNPKCGCSGCSPEVKE
jgi:hypothetical protein